MQPLRSGEDRPNCLFFHPIYPLARGSCCGQWTFCHVLTRGEIKSQGLPRSYLSENGPRHIKTNVIFMCACVCMCMCLGFTFVWWIKQPFTVLSSLENRCADFRPPQTGWVWSGEGTLERERENRRVPNFGLEFGRRVWAFAWNDSTVIR